MYKIIAGLAFLSSSTCFAIAGSSLPTVPVSFTSGSAGFPTSSVLSIQGITSMIPVQVSQSGTWSLGRTWNLSSGSDSVSAVQSGTWTTARSWTLSSGTDSIASAQSGTWNLTNISGTISLPTGASTSALQTTGNSSLSSIDSKLTSPITITGTVAATQSGIWTVQPGNTANTTAWKVDGSAVTQPVSGTLGTTSPVNANAALSSRQTVTTSETNLSAPSNAVGVILECESVNADNLRWGFSSGTGAILSSTLGMLCEPGRDSGYLPLGTGTKLHMIATGGGSDFMDVQWVLSQ